MLIFYSELLSATVPKPQARLPHLVVCLKLLIQYIPQSDDERCCSDKGSA
jgi:hypothetical protein